ncbi:MAG: 16S rRNA (adenine(1518)-N(6)/adenine(1519)-N(6))-dimethyltransferase [Phycisphaerae bacterium]|nr:16S rRNA (adenine(1518)-N(6)/adenine(1519)-N(6))-dimethyltransferase [Phycisphaerae bacterium]
MQSLNEIKRLLDDFGLAPQKRFGQNFLFDQNLLAKVLELAELSPVETVLEVGPGTGSMTEELLVLAGRVVAVEIDKGLHRLLESRLGGRANLTLLHEDVLAGKHEISPAVLAALGDRAVLVSNLPYNIATPLVAQCLVTSWRSSTGILPVRRMGVSPMSAQPVEETSTSKPDHHGQDARGTHGRDARATLFSRLIFTVQAEVADRFLAEPGTPQYGPISILVSLLGRTHLGPTVPNTSFWPRPQVVSRIVRVDFDADRAAGVLDVPALKALLSISFNQRRKQLASVARRKHSAFEPDELLAALDAAHIDHTLRAEDVGPAQFLQVANRLAGKARPIGGVSPVELE